MCQTCTLAALPASGDESTTFGSEGVSGAPIDASGDKPDSSGDEMTAAKRKSLKEEANSLSRIN